MQLSSFIRLPVLTLSIGVSACGGSSSGSNAAGPSPTATSVSVTLQNSIIAVSRTTNATGNVTLANGTVQPVTTGWRSDVPTVATVSDTGLVTGVATGLANIFVTFGGRQGLAQVRVVPNYQGQWQGTYTVRGCTATGLLSAINACAPSSLGVGAVLPARLTLTQNGDAIAGSSILGSVTFTPINAPIGGDGSVAFVNTALGQTVLATDVSWRLNSTVDGQLFGTIVQQWRSLEASGTMTVAAEITLTRSLVRVVGEVAPPAPRSFTARELLRALSTQ